MFEPVAKALMCFPFMFATPSIHTAHLQNKWHIICLSNMRPIIMVTGVAKQRVTIM